MASRDERALNQAAEVKEIEVGEGRRGREKEEKEKEHECEQMTMNGYCLTLGPMETYLQLLLHFWVI